MPNIFWDDIFKLSKKASILEVLSNSPICKDLSRTNLIKISKLVHLRQYSKNEIIFNENESGQCMYIIKSGIVEISKIITSKKIVLTKLDDGSIFGEISLVEDTPRDATAKSIGKTEVLTFFRSDLLKLIDKDPRLSSFILFRLSMILGKRLRYKNIKIK
jgi:CRP/FNR family transcriptional regulator, cyclic AMP receptor protein